MKVYHSINEFQPLPKAIVTSGSFDGVHIAHQKILKKVAVYAQKEGAESVLITFWPHPKKVLNPSAKIPLINTLGEKIQLVKSCGINHLLIIPFNRDFSQMSSLDFVEKVIVETIGTQKLIIGYDHRFGRNREGGFNYLKANAQSFGFEVEEIPRQEIEETTISSTLIRSLLAEGNLLKANQLLGYHYMFSGVVVRGNQLGRTIGFPTANLQLQESDKILPKTGVYAIEASLNNGEKHFGMMNIGFRPTVAEEELTIKTIEVHLFNFSGDIYGSNLTIRIHDFIRKEIKFANIEQLKSQLQKDRDKVYSFFFNS